MPTPLRNVRVADNLWAAALKCAADDGTTVSAVVVAALERYVDSRSLGRALDRVVAERPPTS